MANHNVVHQANISNQLELFELTPAAQLSEEATVVSAADIAHDVRRAYRLGVEAAEFAARPVLPGIYEPDIRDDVHWENMVNGSGFSPRSAEGALTGLPMIKVPRPAKKPTRKPRGTSYPQDEGRAEYDFPVNPTSAERAILTAPEEGATYSGSGREEMLRTRVEREHGAAMRIAKGKPVKVQVAIELARIQKREEAS